MAMFMQYQILKNNEKVEKMLMINEDLEDALKKYIKLLKKEEYFKAHEVLEEGWHPLRLKKDPLANLIKGFINGAIAFEHIKRNKKNMPNKAKKVLASYERYKERVQTTTKHQHLFSEAKEILEGLKKRHKAVFL